MQTQTLRYNFRLKPKPKQEEKLAQFGAYARGVWNLMLSECIRRYNYDKTFLSYGDMWSLAKSLKAFEEFAWVKAFDQANPTTNHSIQNPTTKKTLENTIALFVKRLYLREIIILEMLKKCDISKLSLFAWERNQTLESMIAAS